MMLRTVMVAMLAEDSIDEGDGDAGYDGAVVG